MKQARVVSLDKLNYDIVPHCCLQAEIEKATTCMTTAFIDIIIDRLFDNTHLFPVCAVHSWAIGKSQELMILEDQPEAETMECGQREAY